MTAPCENEKPTFTGGKDEIKKHGNGCCYYTCIIFNRLC